jgi:hypothetical protein
MTTRRAQVGITIAIASGLLCLWSCASEGGSQTGDDDIIEKKDCGIAKVLCERTPPQCPDGQTATVDASGFCYGPCVAYDRCKPGTFNCNQGGPALCEIVPPRCPQGQTLTTRNGCFGPCVPSSICAGSAPTPSAKPDCDIGKVRCEIVTPHCPEGETPTVDAEGFCYGGCSPIADCREGTFQCNDGPAFCEVLPRRCPDGQTRTTTGGCYGPCVPTAVCK